MDEILIEEVRKYTVLYDMTHPKYMDSDFKNQIWQKIGEKIKKDGQLCKSRWNNIRDNYRKALKKAVNKSGQDSKKVKPYKYGVQLGFLHFGDRELKCNINTKSIINDSENTKRCHNGDENTDVRIATTVTETIDTTENEQSLSLASTSRGNIVEIEGNNTKIQPVNAAKTLSSELQTRTISKKRKRPKQLILNTIPHQIAAASLMSYLMEQKKESSTTPLQEAHPVDSFLSAIAPSLKSLSPYQWHLAKTELFSTVQKFELEMLMENQSHETSSMISHSTLCSNEQLSEASYDPVLQDLHQFGSNSSAFNDLT